MGAYPAGGIGTFAMIIPQRPVGFAICSPHHPFPAGHKPAYGIVVPGDISRYAAGTFNIKKLRM
jgi:hypothetical protein